MSVDGRIKTGVPMQVFSIFSRIRGYWRWIQMLPSLRKFNADETAQERLKIIQFYDDHGEAETVKYFGGRTARRCGPGSNSFGEPVGNSRRCARTPPAPSTRAG